MIRDLLTLFMALAALSAVEAAFSLGAGIRWRTLFRRARDRGAPDFTPPVSLLVPCRGLDPGLERNLSAYFRLDYPDYQIIFITGSPGDPCAEICARLRARFPGVPSDLLFAGDARTRGQKVHNLLHGLRRVRPDDRVLAFGDSDIRPQRTWLRDLVGTLEDPEPGVATGFRWYVSRSDNPGSVLRSVWNAATASLMREDRSPFAWGGAMAIRRTTFERMGIAARWQGAVSDDYVVTRAASEHDVRIRFQPRCLSFSFESCSLRELLDWSTRQLAITRIYKPSLWWLAAASETFSNLVFLGGWLTVLLATAVSGPHVAAVGLALLLTVIYALRCWKGWLRMTAVVELFPEQGRALRRHASAYVFWGPLSSLVTLQAVLRSALTREIEWRGIRYRMISPSETRVLDTPGGPRAGRGPDSGACPETD